MGYVDYLSVPDSILGALYRYVHHRVPTVDFLRAVLENDLQWAIWTADDPTMALLPSIVAYVCTEIPPECKGSRAKVAAWLAGENPSLVRYMKIGPTDRGWADVYATVDGGQGKPANVGPIPVSPGAGGAGDYPRGGGGGSGGACEPIGPSPYPPVRLRIDGGCGGAGPPPEWFKS